jgi:hypothetical protein
VLDGIGGGHGPSLGLGFVGEAGEQFVGWSAYHRFWQQLKEQTVKLTMNQLTGLQKRWRRCSVMELRRL